MIYLHPVFTARDLDIFPSFGHRIINQIPAKILIVDINLNLSFLAS